MSLIAKDEKHQAQINAGTLGRNKGHKFENLLSCAINNYSFVEITPQQNISHIFCGNPAHILLQYIANDIRETIVSAKAWWLGALATSGMGDVLLDENGNPITKSMSDILIEILFKSKIKKLIGISVKTCDKKTPTNDQMYFTTAKAFCNLLETNGIHVSNEALNGLCQFCGDIGYRPKDILDEPALKLRISDPNRFYWEELSLTAQNDWENLISNHQDAITRLLFQKAYKNDPYEPDYLLHQTVKYEDFDCCKIALFSMDEIISFSTQYSGYVLSKYTIKKGAYRHDKSIHSAPRFGYIQFQRGGQKQHPTQLQFNLKAGYFNHLPTVID